MRKVLIVALVAMLALMLVSAAAGAKEKKTVTITCISYFDGNENGTWEPESEYIIWNYAPWVAWQGDEAWGAPFPDPHEPAYLAVPRKESVQVRAITPDGYRPTTQHEWVISTKRDMTLLAGFGACDYWK